MIYPLSLIQIIFFTEIKLKVMSITMKAAVTLVLIFTFMQATSTINAQPQLLPSTQNVGNCSYVVKIKTSCTSAHYTLNQINITFGDTLNKVYSGRIDDPQKGRFRRCRMDTFGHIFGPCTYPCCMLFYRTGYDGWKVDTATIFVDAKSVTFFFNSMYIPQGVWYGLNNCIGADAASSPENTQKKI
ncbi:embryo-specific protein ATS3A-like [Pyrus communis]|uniref:embryo-specific protein ATS3A-like n=1 Tax=Pyrus communis TaxID=23211 RepID=UPI0035C00E37